jgi:20S proteasome subunit alpha 2
MEIEDAIHTAVLTLKEGLEGSMTESSLEIGIAIEELVKDKEGVERKVGQFRRLTSAEIKDYLANIA